MDKTAKQAQRERRPHDRTKMRFRGEEHGKGRLVLAVVKAWLQENPKSNMKQLKEAFPDELNSLGVVQPVKVAREKSEKHRRFFIKEAIGLADGTEVAVCSDWGSNNISRFLTRARQLGYRATRGKRRTERLAS